MNSDFLKQQQPLAGLFYLCKVTLYQCPENIFPTRKKGFVCMTKDIFLRKLFGFFKKHRIFFYYLIPISFLALMLLPLFALSFFMNPAADDFGNAVTFFGSYVPGRPPIIHSLSLAFTFWLNWQGTYFSNFLCFFNPYLFYGESVLPLFSIITQLLIYSSIFVVVRSVLKNVFNCSNWLYTLWYFAGMIFLTTQFFNLAESFYWYTGAAVYPIPFSIGLYALSLYLYTYRAKKKASVILTILSCFLFFLSAGGALPIAVFISGILCYITVYEFVRNGKNKYTALLITFVTVACSLLNLAAPGNFKRQVNSQATNIISIKKTIWLSLYSTSQSVTQYVKPLYILMIFALLSVISYKVLKNSNLQFKLPALVSAATVLLLFTMNVPFIYGIGGLYVPPRYTHIIIIVSCLLIFFNLLYWWGWFLTQKEFKKEYFYVKYASAILSVVLVATTFSIIPFSALNSVDVVHAFSLGIIQSTKTQRSEALNIIKESADDIVILEPFTASYAHLHDIGLTEDPESWINIAIARFFDKEQVYIRSN